MSGAAAAGRAEEVATAAEAFAAAWAELLGALPGSYACTMTCGEAEAAADLFDALDRHDDAQAIIDAHALTDEPGDAHYILPSAAPL